MAELTDLGTYRRLKDSSGGGTFDDMEARVSKLEGQFEKLDAKVDAIRADVAEMKGMMKMMPTSLQLLGFAVAVFIAAGVMKYLAP